MRDILISCMLFLLGVYLLASWWFERTNPRFYRFMIGTLQAATSRATARAAHGAGFPLGLGLALIGLGMIASEVGEMIAGDWITVGRRTMIVSSLLGTLSIVMSCGVYMSGRPEVLFAPAARRESRDGTGRPMRQAEDQPRVISREVVRESTGTEEAEIVVTRLADRFFNLFGSYEVRVNGELIGEVGRSESATYAVRVPGEYWVQATDAYSGSNVWLGEVSAGERVQLVFGQSAPEEIFDQIDQDRIIALYEV